MFWAFIATMCAQDYYYIEYNDLDGNTCYGFMQWSDEEDITIRLKGVDGNDDIVYERDLNCHAQMMKEQGMEFLLIVSEGEDEPDFAFGYGGKKFEDDEVTPWVSIGDADLFEAKEFGSVSMTDMDEEFISLFFDKDEEQYQKLLSAISSAKKDEAEIAQNIGDGDAIFETVISALAEIQGKEKKDLTDNYVEAESTEETNTNAKSTLHLMLVVNTQVDDIGEACSKDYDHVLSEMKSVARSLDIPLKLYPVTGNDFSRDGVVAMLNKLRPASNDIVVFLYSGHGFRFDDQESRFPQMDLTTSSYEELGDNYLAMSDVFNNIQKKGARLNIVMSDCCNTPIGEEAPVSTGTTLYSRATSNFSLDRLRDLFLNTRGSILSTASSPGEPSVCDQSGGFYTIGFIRSLRKEVNSGSTEPVSWLNVMDNAIEAAKKRSERDGDGQHGLRMAKNYK